VSLVILTSISLSYIYSYLSCPSWKVSSIYIQWFMLMAIIRAWNVDHTASSHATKGWLDHSIVEGSWIAPKEFGCERSLLRVSFSSFSFHKRWPKGAYDESTKWSLQSFDPRMANFDTQVTMKPLVLWSCSNVGYLCRTTKED